MNWERFVVVLIVLLLLAVGVVEDPQTRGLIILSILMGYGFKVARSEK